MSTQRCSTSPAIRETPVGVATMRNEDTIKRWRGRGVTGLVHCLLVGVKQPRQSGKQFGSFLACHYLQVSHHPAGHLTGVHTKICTLMFTAASLVIARNWK